MVINAGTVPRRVSGSPEKSPPTERIEKIGSLKRFADQKLANDLLHQIAKLVAPVLHEYNLKVGTLCEMFPKNRNLLGLNINRGQKILLRLRQYSNEKQFYPLYDLVGTMFHELTHNIYGSHDNNFYKFLDKLIKRFEEIQTGALTGYYCEEEKLGTRGSPAFGYISIREKRIKAFSKGKYKAESRRLGSLGGETSPSEQSMQTHQLRRLMLEAAERRRRDATWCRNYSHGLNTDILDDFSDVEIVGVDDVQKKKNMPNYSSKEPETPHNTGKSFNSTDTSKDEPEIIVIDA